MKRITTLLFAIASIATVSFAAEKNAVTNPVPDQAGASYTQTLEKRVGDILNALALSDTNKAARVHDILLAHYRALNANDAPLRASPKDTNVVAQVHAARKTLHDDFLSKLSQNLTPEQVEVIKDKMTYNKVKVTYAAYCDIIPGLTDAQKAHILQTLKDAREEAMDGGSSDEKSAIFKKYKGRIANYLAKEGIDEQKARKEWGAKQKAKAAAAKTNAVPEVK